MCVSECEMPEMVAGVCERLGCQEHIGECARLQSVCLSYEVSGCERGHCVLGGCEMGAVQLQGERPGCVCVVGERKPPGQFGRMEATSSDGQLIPILTVPRKWSFHWGVKNFLGGSSEVTGHVGLHPRKQAEVTCAQPLTFLLKGSYCARNSPVLSFTDFLPHRLSRKMNVSCSPLEPLCLQGGRQPCSGTDE